MILNIYLLEDYNIFLYININHLYNYNNELYRDCGE
jgi:hypothetical protein